VITSNTPETDAEVGYFDLETAVNADFTRRLERERDEAIELLKETSWYATTTSQENTEKFLRKIGKWEDAK
jgi:hypothetical protein